MTVFMHPSPGCSVLRKGFDNHVIQNLNPHTHMCLCMRVYIYIPMLAVLFSYIAYTFYLFYVFSV